MSNVEEKYRQWVSVNWDADQELMAMRLEKYVESRLVRSESLFTWAKRAATTAAIVAGCAAIVIAFAYLVTLNNGQDQARRAETAAARAETEECRRDKAVVQDHIDAIVTACAVTRGGGSGGM